MKTSFKKALLYTGVLLFVLLSYLISRVLRLEQGNVRYVRYANLLFQISGVVILLRDCLRKKEKNTYTEEQITGLILSMGIFMRVVYLLYTPLTVRSHDLWGIDLSSGGHASYLLLAMQGMLPPDNYLQFYQQPLYYLREPFFKAAKRTSRLFGSVLSGGCGQDGFLYRVLLQSADCLCHFQGMRTFGKGSVPGFAPCLLFAGLFSERRKAGTGCSLRNVYASGISFYPEMGKGKELEKYAASGGYLRTWHDDQDIHGNTGSVYGGGFCEEFL